MGSYAAYLGGQLNNAEKNIVHLKDKLKATEMAVEVLADEVRVLRKIHDEAYHCRLNTDANPIAFKAINKNGNNSEKENPQSDKETSV